MEEEVKNVRLGGQEPVDLIIKEITWEEEGKAVMKAKTERIDPLKVEKITEMDPLKIIVWRLIYSIKNVEATEDQIKKTPKKDMLRVRMAYDRLNELSDAEKSGPEKDDREKGLRSSGVRRDSPSKGTHKN